MKKQQSRKEQPKTRANRRSLQELTDEQLQQVTGGLNPQPLPPGRTPPDPV